MSSARKTTTLGRWGSSAAAVVKVTVIVRQKIVEARRSVLITVSIGFAEGGDKRWMRKPISYCFCGDRRLKQHGIQPAFSPSNPSMLKEKSRPSTREFPWMSPSMSIDSPSIEKSANERQNHCSSRRSKITWCSQREQRICDCELGPRTIVFPAMITASDHGNVRLPDSKLITAVVLQGCGWL